MTGPDGAFCEKSFLTERERNDHFARRHPQVWSGCMPSLRSPQQLAPILASPAGVTGPDGNPIPNPDPTAPDATILIKPKVRSRVNVALMQRSLAVRIVPRCTRLATPLISTSLAITRYARSYRRSLFFVAVGTEVQVSVLR
jgi:hypothetical protein